MVQIFLQILAARVTAMTIKNSKVADADRRTYPQILNTTVSVFHRVALANRRGNTSVVSLHQEFQVTNSHGILRQHFKSIILWHTSVHATRFCGVQIKIPHSDASIFEIVVDVAVLGRHFLALKDERICHFGTWL